MIKTPAEVAAANPRIPVGLNYVAPSSSSKCGAGVAALTSTSVVSASSVPQVVGAAGPTAGKRGSSPVALPAVENAGNSGEENSAKCKNKSKVLLSICLSFCLSLSLSVCLFLSLCLFIIYLFVCLSVSLISLGLSLCGFHF